MIKEIAIGFRTQKIADGFIIQDPATRHPHEDEIISIFRRRKDAKKNRVWCAGTMLEATHRDFEKMWLVAAMYAHDSTELADDSVFCYVHPKHYKTIVDQIGNL